MEFVHNRYSRNARNMEFVHNRDSRDARMEFHDNRDANFASTSFSSSAPSSSATEDPPPLHATVNNCDMEFIDNHDI
jgi:hypothetical protein